MASAFAHVDGFGTHDHLLIQHSSSVANLAQRMAFDAASGNGQLAALAAWAGWLHDLGKYRDEFQEYLMGRRQKGADTQHAVYGAAWAWNQALPRAVTLAILGHHSGLHDLSSALDRIANAELKPALEAGPLADRLFGEASALGMVLPALCTEFIPRKRQRLQPEFRHELAIRMLFSCLADADYLDTEEFMRGRARTPNVLAAKELFERLHQHVKTLSGGAAPSDVNRVRLEVFQACVDGAEGEQGFYSLTAPTGSGKTLAMMAFALRHAHLRKMRRVVVVLPFLSIIEQNAAIYRDLLGADVVVEHHSAVERGPQSAQSGASSESAEAAGETDDQGRGADRARLSARLATENWDAPVIVTTAVQFLESLFARRPGQCRKLHNIARSVVLFDEVQSLPLNLLEPILCMLRDLKNEYGCSFLFSSATQPRFGRDVQGLASGFTAGECLELAPEPERVFNVLRRTQFNLAFRDEGAWSWNTLIENIIREPRVLVVVNFRKQAQELYNKLSAQKVPGVYHLSSTMCAAHRRAVLGTKGDPDDGTIYHALLRNDSPCRLISTQVIEAGVDISFPVVFRHIAPFDAVLQAAGRCNREGEIPPCHDGRPGGRVVVFNIAGEADAPRGLYSHATAETRSRLVNWTKHPDTLATDPAAFGAYHDSLIQWHDTDQQEIQDLRRHLRFEAVANAFKVIDQAGTGVVTPYDEAADLIGRIRVRGVVTYEERRRLQRYTVNLFPNWLTALGADLYPLVPGGETLVCSEARYDQAVGVSLSELPIDRFTFFNDETA